MKKLTYILLMLLVLSACTDRQEYAAMRHGLDSINERNRNDEPFTAADVQPYIDYFDRHGEPNDQMLANYMMGSAYRDEGNAPMALKFFRFATELADTTADNCDYRILSRVYGQIAHLFHIQRSPNLELAAQHKAIQYAWIAKDTVSAIIFTENLAKPYHMLNQMDSALYFSQKAASLFKAIGRTELAVRTLGLDIDIYLRQENYNLAKEAIEEYENKSLFFDEHGNIVEGKESFYNFKGIYFEGVGQRDSAEYYYRKLLFYSHNLNSKEAAYKGLLSIYQKSKNGDSIAKYSNLYCQANDSASFAHSADEITRMQAMYDYTRHQEVARQKTIEANRSRQAIMAGSFVGLLVITLLLFALYRNRRKKQEEITLLQRQYEHDVDKLEQARYDLVRMQEEQLTRLMEEKEADIRELQRQVDSYGQQARPEDRLEGFLSETASYRRFRHFIMHPQEKATVDDWKLLHDMIDQKLPAFRTTLYSAQPGLKASDYDICVLDRLYFTPSEIAMLTGKNLSSITMKRVRLLGKLFHVTGKGSQFDAFIRKIS